MAKPVLTLPDGSARSLGVVRDEVIAYAENYPAVFHLYDFPSGGPHDEVLPIDVLAPNALNAWAGSPPMTAMTEVWKVRGEIARAVAPVSREPLEELSDAQVAAEVPKVGAALDFIDAIPGYGSTTAS